jgi:hypothetical protein
VSRVRCSGCQEWINNRSAGVAEAVKGYRVNRGGGGANQITLPTSLGRWLCPACLSVARGADVDQGRLF